MLTHPRVRRRLHQLILILYALVMLGMAAMVIGPFLNDRAIEANPGRALATVRDVSTLRTTVDYTDEQGVLHTPAAGLLYPTGLGEGQRVWVLYDRGNPELVKVEGREWTLAVIPALSSAAVASVVAAGLWWAVGAAGRRAEPAGARINPELGPDSPDRDVKEAH